MQIGFDGSRAFSKNRTGTENYSYQLLKALSKIDKQNQYIIYLRPEYLVSEIKNNHWPNNFKFKILNFKFAWTQVGLAFQTFKDRLDILFIPAHTLPLIRKPGLKTVITVHDLGSEYLPQMHQLKQRLYLSLMQKYQLKTVDKIIAVSKATKKDLLKKIGIDSKKVNLVYEGYDSDKFKNQNSKIKNDIQVSNLMQFFLFVGTVQPRKNLERVIRAFAKYEEVAWGPASSLLSEGRIVSRRASSTRSSLAAATRQDPSSLSILATNFVIIGSKGWMSDQIYSLPKKLGIEDRVKFLDYVSDEELPVLYSNAKALIFPSLFEGFGLPILEAQACGCPVLTSNISSMPEVAGKGAIYVNPYDIDDIVKGMKRLKSQELRDRLIKAGYENIKRFSWETCARETLKVLETP